MTELIEKATTPAMVTKEEEKKLHKCDWKVCKKTHEKKPNYPKNGKVSKSSTYATKWVAAGLEPWVLHGSGKDSMATVAEYSKESKDARALVVLPYPAYHTEKHHLISVHLFESYPDLSHNAELIGYDVNHKKNGMCLPYFTIDIVQHGLPCHRGSHPSALYDDKIRPMLADIELDCIEYCEIDVNGTSEYQEMLISELNTLSGLIVGGLKSGELKIRSAADQDKKDAYARYKKLTER